MTVTKTGEVYQLKKDDEYVYSDEAVKLGKPANPECGVGDYASGQEVWFSFFALEQSYPIGVKVEIKKAGSEDYEFYDIEVPYQAQIYVDCLGADKFNVGVNSVRICNAGAPVFTKDKRYYMAYDSDYITFEIVVYDDGTINMPYVGQE